MIETYLASPAGPLFALESGEGDLVVLLHGVTANAYVFVPLIERLSARHHVVALDQRGHGRSPAPPDGRYGPGRLCRRRSRRRSVVGPRAGGSWSGTRWGRATPWSPGRPSPGW